MTKAYKKGGQEVLTPTFDCVSPNAQGTLTAFFGHDNKNGVAVTVPYGIKNSLARDTFAQRPSRFLPGTHDFTFGVDFASNQTVSWTLSPDNSPTTTVTVNQSSRHCGAAEADQTECALSCRASQRASGCATLPTFEACVGFCLDQIGFIRDRSPNVWRLTAPSTSAPPPFPPTPRIGCATTSSGPSQLDPCAAQFDALNTCFSE